MWAEIRKFFESHEPVTVKQEELKALAMASGDDTSKSKRLDSEPDLRVIAYDIMVTIMRDGEM